MWASVAPAWGEHAESADTRGVAVTARLLEPSALRPGRVAVAVWGPRARNPWLGVVVDAVSAQLGGPVPPPGVPGPFALEDADRLGRLLTGAGLDEVVVDEVPVPLRDATFDAWLTRTAALAGPLAKRLAMLPDPARWELRARLEEAVRPYRSPAGLDFPGLSLVAAGRRA